MVRLDTHPRQRILFRNKNGGFNLDMPEKFRHAETQVPLRPYKEVRHIDSHDGVARKYQFVNLGALRRFMANAAFRLLCTYTLA